MLRTSVSKFKQACILSYMPRAFRGDARYPLGRPDKQSHGGQRRAHKSTSSTSDSQGDTETERCKKIIERTFEPNAPFTELNEKEANQIALAQIITPQVPPSNETHREKCQRIIKQIFDEDGTVEELKNKDVPVHIPLTETLQATTDKNNEEKLVQKIEVIEETPLVEAHKQRLEGFNAPPKVLGARRKRKSIEKHNPIFNCSTDKPVYTRKRFAVINCSDKSRARGSKGHTTLDELAKRCLDAPPGKIDERLLKEMEKLGVPPSSSGRGSKNRVDDSEFIQADIMKRPRRPVAKTEIDLIPLQNIDVDKHRVDLPPPFELAAEKIKPEPPKIGVEALETEKLQPFLMNESDRSSLTSNVKENNPPQRLLSHMAAAVMSDETVKDKVKETLIENQNKQKPFELSDTVNVKLEEPTELENREGSDTVSGEHIVAAQEPATSYEKEAGNLSPNLQNLLQSRCEHLANERTKPFNLVEQKEEINLSEEVNETEKQEIAQDNIAILHQAGSHVDDDPLIIFKETSPKSSESAEAATGGNTEEVFKFNMSNIDAAPENFTETTTEREYETEVYDEKPNYTIYKPERIIPGRMINKDNMLFEGNISCPDPGVVIRDYDVDTSGNPTPINPDTIKYNDQNFVQSNISISPQNMNYLQGRIYDENSQRFYQFSVKRLDTPIPVADTSKPPVVSENTDESSEEPILVAETGRLKRDNFQEQELILDHVLSATNEKRVNVPSKYIPIQNLVRPLIDKGTMASTESLQMPAAKPEDESATGGITHFTNMLSEKPVDEPSEPSPQNDYVSVEDTKQATAFVASDVKQVPPPESPTINAEIKSNTVWTKVEISSTESPKAIAADTSNTEVPCQFIKQMSDKPNQESAKTEGSVTDYAKNKSEMNTVDSPISKTDECVTETSYYVDKDSVKPKNKFTGTSSNIHSDRVETPKEYILSSKNEYVIETQPQMSVSEMSTGESPSLKSENEHVTGGKIASCNSPEQSSVEGHNLKPEHKFVTGNQPQHTTLNKSSEESSALKADSENVTKSPTTLANDSVDSEESAKSGNECVAGNKPQLSTLGLSSIDTIKPDTVNYGAPVVAKETYEVVPPKLNEDTQPSHLAKESMNISSVDMPKLSPSVETPTKTSLIQGNPYTPAVETPCLKSYAETVSLSELVRKVRERNRQEDMQSYLKVKYQSDAQVEPVEGKCGKKVPECPPPAPKCPPPPPPPCPPTDPPCPKPCKPDCPPGCPPAPCPPPKPACPPDPCPSPKPACPPCPPAKKSPCDKFKCSPVQLQDVLSLLVYLGPQLHIPVKLIVPLLACTLKFTSESALAKSNLLVQEIVRRFNNMCSIVLLVSLKEEVAAVEATLADGEVTYARTYEPWSPIPSWPIPQKQEKKKLVCPKDGCKLPKLTDPCRDVNPCINFPKPNSLTKRPFSLIELITFLTKEYVEPLPKI